MSLAAVGLAVSWTFSLYNDKGNLFPLRELKYDETKFKVTQQGDLSPSRFKPSIFLSNVIYFTTKISQSLCC